MAIERLKESLAQILKDYYDDPRIGFVQGISAATNAAYSGTVIGPDAITSPKVDTPPTEGQLLEITPTDESAPIMERLKSLFRQLPDETSLSSLTYEFGTDNLSLELQRIYESATIPERKKMSRAMYGLARAARPDQYRSGPRIETIGALKQTPARVLDAVRNFGPTMVSYVGEILGRPQQEVKP